MKPDFPNTRWSLISRLQNETGGHATLVEWYAPSIERYLTYKFPIERDNGLLDDIIQEVLIDLMERPALFENAHPHAGGRFRYVVMNAAYLLAHNARRRTLRLVHRGSEAEPVAAETVPSETIAIMDQAWAESVLAAAWEEVAAWAEQGVLEPDTMLLLKEHLIRGVSLRALSERLHLPLTTCFRRVAQGRTYLQKAIGDRLVRAGEIASPECRDACEHMLDLIQWRRKK